MHEHIVERFHENYNKKYKEKQRIHYSGKGVRIKTKMIAFWKTHPNFAQDVRNRRKKPKKCSTKNKEKKQPKTKSKRTPIPQCVRRQKKWKHHREEKDTYEYLMSFSD